MTAKASRTLEVIAFLNGLETSWLLNPSLPVEDVAAAWRDSQLAQMTVGHNRPPATEIKDISSGAEDQAGTPTTG